MGIVPRISADSIKCLVIDDAPFRTENFNWKLKVITAYYLGTMDFADEKLAYNAYDYFNTSMPPCFFDAGPMDGFPEEMRACGEKMSTLGVENEVYIPKAELPHGFLNLVHTEPEAAECVRRIIAFMDKHTK